LLNRRLRSWRWAVSVALTATASCRDVRSASVSSVRPSDAPALAITHVTVIDMTGAPPRPDMTVVVVGDRISGIGPSDSLSPPVAAVVVEARGKFVIPGLWDMHAHSTFDRYQRTIAFPLDIAYGVTGVRDMAGDCFGACADKDTVYNPVHGSTSEMVHRWEREIADGTLLGPRIVAASAMLDGPHPRWEGAVAVHDTAEARAAVREAQRRGADFIKVYSGLSREAYFAIADEAKRRGIPFAGHVPDAITLAEASDAGQVSMEHLIKMPDACSNRAADVERMAQENTTHPATTPADWGARIRAMVQLQNESFSLRACAPIFERFVRNHTWQVPTLTASRGVYYALDVAFTADRRRQFMAAADTAWWQGIVRRQKAMFTASDMPSAKLFFQHHVQIVGAMYNAGVGVMAGTDVTNPWVYWGSSLHDDLALFVEAGMPPLAALQSATIQPARFLHATDTLGTLQPGKVADLVVLDANPLVDIHNTQRIHAIIVRGRLIDSVARQRLLDGARSAAEMM
jgi:imidazolonepropionase-like amidohydrolase